MLEMRLPPTWTHGLREIPGYEEDTRILRVTTDRRQLRDEEGHRLGFIGRAHPVVRRALDRVRNLRLGDRRLARPPGERGPGRQGMDRQSSARSWASVRAHGPRVRTRPGCSGRRPRTGAGRRGARGWLARTAEAAPPSAASGTEASFEDWAEEARSAALESALDVEHAEAIEGSGGERRDLLAWLRARADTICGAARTCRPSSSLLGELPRWKTLSEPSAAPFGLRHGRATRAAARREADGVLRLYEAPA